MRAAGRVGERSDGLVAAPGTSIRTIVPGRAKSHRPRRSRVSDGAAARRRHPDPDCGRAPTWKKLMPLCFFPAITGNRARRL